MASGRATLKELMTFYSVEDVALINEVATVEGYNTHLVNQEQARRNADR